MHCPYCLNKETKVVDKRDADGRTKRRRECRKCDRRFNTREMVERQELRVIKKDGRREAFQYEKIKRGVQTACEKRPISSEAIDKMLTMVEEKLSEFEKSELNDKKRSCAVGKIFCEI